jgi:hypothetical protein
MVVEHKKLVIHGGHGKAGSSAIQAFLYANKDYLHQSGILVLDLSLSSAIVGPSGFSSTEDFYAYLLQRPHEFAGRLVEIFSYENPVFNDFNTVIWSNESLITFYELLGPKLQLLARRWDLQLVLFFRNQVEWIASAYNQWVIVDSPSKDEPISFAKHVLYELSDQSKNTKYQEILDGWSRLAPSARIEALPYPIKTDVCKPFAETVFSCAQDLVYSEFSVNDTASLSKLFLIKYLRKKLAQHDEISADALNELISAVINAQPRQSTYPLLSIYEQEDYDFARLERHFESDNEALRLHHKLRIPPPRISRLQPLVNSDELIALCLEMVISLALCQRKGSTTDTFNSVS